MSTGALNNDLFAAAVNAMPEDTLSVVRDRAANQFTSHGFPTTRDEDWKYTNLSSAADISNAWLRECVASPDTVVNPSPADKVQKALSSQTEAHWLLIRNGSVDIGSLDRVRDALGPEIKISKLSERPDQSAIDIDDPMSAFNAALLRDGLHIHVDANAEVTKPLGILQIDDPSRQATQTRIVIELAPYSSLKVIESAISTGTGRQFTNSVSQADLAAGSKLSYVRIQQRNEDHVGVNRMTTTLDRDASFSHNEFDFGGAMTRNDLVVRIAGENAQVRLHGLYLASDAQHIDNHTRVEHRVGPSTSHEEYRGVLTGRSRCVFNGQAVVFEGADGTDANQSNHNLLLSDRAEIDTKPELEIYADDVKCSHGATVGQLDEASLFYLRTRGLDQESARQLLTQAFAAGILSELAVEECREYLVNAIGGRLSGLVGDMPQ